MFTPREPLIVDACCGMKLVRILRKLGIYAQYYREVRPNGWPCTSSDKRVLQTCQENGAILLTRDRRFAELAMRENRGRVIELKDTHGLIGPVEEAYVVLNKLGYPIQHFMLATQVHFGLIWNLESNRSSSLKNPMSLSSRAHRIMGTDPLLQLPIGTDALPNVTLDPYS